jgi:hypothetical protein
MRNEIEATIKSPNKEKPRTRNIPSDILSDFEKTKYYCFLKYFMK